MAVAIVVPFRGGCPHREQAWGWVQAHYAEHHPDWDLIDAPAPDGPWSKGAAVNPVVERCEAGIVIQADADVWCDGLERAVYAVACGLAAWSIPHALVHRMSEDGTAAVATGADWRDQPLAQEPYRGIEGGGVVVARREVFCSAPLDRRYVGWGQEDESQAIALRTLWGDPWRGEADLLHLWHPPQERYTRRRGSPQGWALRGRYRAARDDPAAMAALIEENRVDRETDEAGHDLAPCGVR